MNDSWITATNVTSFAGATCITTVIANGMQRAFNFNPAWLALLVAEALCFASIPLGLAPPGQSLGLSLLLAFINGFFVFAASSGAAHIGSKTIGVRGAVEARRTGDLRRHFWTSWP